MKESPRFTGERFIPGTGGFQMAYEHLHRYLLALPLAGGKVVLDVASGDGYGSALLARVARKVFAVEIDGPTVRAARAAHAAENIVFLQGDALSLPLGDRTVDLVIGLEVLEHLQDAERLLAEIARVAKPHGLALVSTPNKAEYSDARGYANPFHVREYYRDEFLELMRRHFRHVALGSQRVRAGSVIAWEGSEARRQEIVTAPLPGPGRVPLDAMYFVALCCETSDPAAGLRESAYLDESDGLIGEWEAGRQGTAREIGRLNREISALGEWGRELETRLQELHAALAEMDRTVEERDRTIGSLQEELRVETGRRDRLLQELRQEFEERSRWAQDLERTVAARDAEIVRVNSELDRAAAHLARIRHALLYRVLCRLGVLPR